ncbi:glycosyltransferase [Acinetobacter sp. 1239920]|uniref:glycosyltransferase n=1 Tax=Acinetobacter sp. 1239920 TaxID=1310680 RepID=UPI000445EA76|nr:glycosyltransferase [Acinetobacter sp. 1239920]EXE57088.1 glycosyl transferases group 1 family protein [Acinetobacter sp. 1239920]
MKILYVITGLGGGGAEKVVVDLADQMIKQGHTVKIAFLKGDTVVRPKNQSIELIYLGLESLTQFTLAYQKYKKLINDFQPDVVHAHMVHANIFARLCRFFLKTPRLICTAHSNNEGGRLRMCAYRLTHNLADITTNVSQAASQNFENLGAVPQGGILTTYNGIDLNYFNKCKYEFNETRSNLGVDASTTIFLAVGRFHAAKDYPNLLKAFSIYLQHQEKVDNLKLYIAGDGDEQARLELKALIEKYNLNNNVNLLGRREDIPALMSVANFFVLSSSYEGFGLVIAEAMACNTFVISTDCGGSAEIMGDTGILVPPQNSEALAQALNQAVNKTALEIQENNLKARQRVEELFSLEKSVQNWLKLYEQN